MFDLIQPYNKRILVKTEQTAGHLVLNYVICIVVSKEYKNYVICVVANKE